VYDVYQLIDKMTGDLRLTLRNRHIDTPALIGIHTGGVWIARHLHHSLDIDEPLGSLDISFYRDDFSRIGMHPQVLPSELPFDVDGRHIILVDDVLYTGRTVRAALNEIFDYGRPQSVLLAVLVDRGGRELPIEADVVGKSIELSNDEQIKLTGPEPLTLIHQHGHFSSKT
jgi:pyrimidine operon attenuation protein/uracil phosphoribosyltransferase